MTNEITGDKVIPSAVNVEKAALSAIMQYPEQSLEIYDDLGMKVDDFYHPSHRVLLKRILSEVKKGGRLDLVVFTQTLQEHNELDRIGGPAAVSEVYTYSPHCLSCKDHLEIVRDRATRRALIAAAEKAKDAAYDVTSEDCAVTIAEKADKLIQNAVEGRETSKTAYTMDEMLKEAAQRYQEAQNNPESEAFGMKTGFPTFDHMTGGLKEGNVYVIAARPSMGKTSFMMALIEALCMVNKNPCDFYSSEMNQESVIDRAVASYSRINVRDLMKGAITKSMMSSVARTFRDFKGAPLMVDDMSGVKASQIRARTRRRVAKEGVKALFVDYLQILGAENEVERRYLRILCQRAMQEMKAIAKECRIPVVILAQLNREADRLDVHKHQMSHIKDCGNVEQDADLIATLGHDADGPLIDQPVDVRYINILKQRNGPTGTIKVNFLKESTRFYE